jgi:YndJ-like protein
MMKTTVDQTSEKQNPSSSAVSVIGVGRRGRNGRTSWAAGWAMGGAAGWAAIAVLARLEFIRIGMIELMFLFGPLVIVPLGMELGRLIRCPGNRFARRVETLAQSLQPLGAVLAVAAMCLPPGRRAAILATGWMAVCGLMATGGLAELIGAFAEKFPDKLANKRTHATRITQTVASIARVDLAVGGAWLVASRLGLRPMGIQEPIGLLTAVHFHYAGFATATIAAVTLQSAEERGKPRWLRRIVMLVALMPFLIAVGFVISPVLKVVAAVVFSCSVAALAAFLWSCARKIEDRTAQRFLRIATAAALGGMVLSTTYAVLNFLGSEALPIPLMASTHGVLNAVGFCMFGLLGWLMEVSAEKNLGHRGHRGNPQSPIE